MHRPHMTDGKGTSKAGKALSRLGAAKGGRARAATMTADERKEIARNAVRERWRRGGKVYPTGESDAEAVEAEVQRMEAQSAAEEVPYSLLQGTLKIGDIEAECHVLSNHMRVFTQREIVKLISGGRTSGDLKVYLSRNPLTANDFAVATGTSFKIPGQPNAANGFEATDLVEICDRYLQARDQKLLKPSQFALAKQAEIILRSCAKIGIIALIDEATGYQKIRAKRDLQIKMQAYIAEEMQEWARMFPEEFWLELARLEGIKYSPRSRPLRWGKYIMMFVYDAIDNDVGEELRKKNPNPRFLKNHHQ